MARRSYRRLGVWVVANFPHERLYRLVSKARIVRIHVRDDDGKLREMLSVNRTVIPVRIILISRGKESDQSVVCQLLESKGDMGFATYVLGETKLPEHRQLTAKYVLRDNNVPKQQKNCSQSRSPSPAPPSTGRAAHLACDVVRQLFKDELKKLKDETKKPIESPILPTTKLAPQWLSEDKAEKYAWDCVLAINGGPSPGGVTTASWSNWEIKESGRV